MIWLRLGTLACPIWWRMGNCSKLPVVVPLMPPRKLLVKGNIRAHLLIFGHVALFFMLYLLSPCPLIRIISPFYTKKFNVLHFFLFRGRLYHSKRNQSSGKGSNFKNAAGWSSKSDKNNRNKNSSLDYFPFTHLRKNYWPIFDRKKSWTSTWRRNFSTNSKDEY